MFHKIHKSVSAQQKEYNAAQAWDQRQLNKDDSHSEAEESGSLNC